MELSARSKPDCDFNAEKRVNASNILQNWHLEWLDFSEMERFRAIKTQAPLWLQSCDIHEVFTELHRNFEKKYIVPNLENMLVINVHFPLKMFFFSVLFLSLWRKLALYLFSSVVRCQIKQKFDYVSIIDEMTSAKNRHWIMYLQWFALAFHFAITRMSNWQVSNIRVSIFSLFSLVAHNLSCTDISFSNGIVWVNTVVCLVCAWWLFVLKFDMRTFHLKIKT